MSQKPQVKFIKVQTYDNYVSAVKTYPSAIVFAQFADATAVAPASTTVTTPINLPQTCGFPMGTKLIYANGIQYDVTNLTKISGINSSIDYLDSSLATLYEIVNELNTNLGTDYLDLSTYVRTTVDGSISDISTRLSRALTNASVYTEAGTDSSVKITLVTRTVGDVSTNTEIKVNGSEYVNVQHTNDAVSVALQNITANSSDITENSNKLVKADDLYSYVTTQINNLEGALIFKDGIADASTLNGLTPETGDVYVATNNFEFNSNTVESGDLLIYGENSWVIIERNLDGAVEATDELVNDHVAVGSGNHTVKTTDFILPTVDDSTGIAGATANTSVLTTQYAVKDYVDNELSTKLAAVKVTATTGTPNYVDVNVDTIGRDISVGVKTVSLADFADLTYDGQTGKWVAVDGVEFTTDGLATASDVARAIQDNELVVATALNTFKDKIGLENDLTIDWEGKYTNGTTIVEAVKNINVAGDISTAVDGLNSQVAATAGSVLTKVIQENGKLTAKEEAALKINNVQFTANSNEISAEITANDIKLTSASAATDTVKLVIDDLRDGKIGTINTGNAAISVADSSTTELTSSFTQHTIEYSTVADTSKDASILTELLVTKTTATATALATDAYVQEQIAIAVSNALVWEEGFD